MWCRRVATGAVFAAVLTVGSLTGTLSAGAAPPPPSVSSIYPASGPTAGKTQVSIFGTYFVNVTGVSFGTTPARFRQSASNQLVATAPPSLPGTVHVTVRTLSGTSATTTADLYTYVPTPTVTSVSPGTGSTDGGTTVTLTGTEFSSGATVLFGNATATIVSQTSTSLVVTSPPSKKAGPVGVQVVTSYGASEPGPSFTYVSPPAISAVSPNIGPTGGGLQVTLTVANLYFPATVTFGGVLATIYSSTQNTVTVVAPAHAAGTVDVQLRTPYGISPTGSADRYTYVAPPTITRLDPAGGGTSGSTRVTVTGTGFVQVMSVTFGGTSAAIVGNPDPTTLVVMTPSHPQGVVDVQVRTSFGLSAYVPADLYTYVNPAQPVVFSVTPNSGSTRGGTQVVVSGSYFNDLTSVMFGNRAASVVSANGSVLTVIAPSHPEGVVDVRVSTRYGTSATGPADRFTYVAPPTITSIAPASGPSTGGTHVTITGTDLATVRSVTFGGVPAAIVSASATSVTVTSPAHDPGTVDVRLATDYGTTPIVTADRFTYIAWPTVTAISPSFGPTRGGVRVSISGANFIDVTSVTFDGVPGVMDNMYFPGSIGVMPPPHAAGVVDIQVTTSTGTSPVTLADRYTYDSGPGWSESAPIPHNLQGGPTSISCPTSDFCVLIDGSNWSAFDGSVWSKPANTGDQDLTSVSCASSTFCVAVDLGGGVITFDGTSWTPQLGRHVDDSGGFTAVSCTSSEFCLAVDNNGNAFTLNGSTWSGPTNVDAMALNAVSCTSPTFCMAVSQDGNALTFNGSGWSAPTNLVPMGLVGVSCLSPDFCVAVHATGEAFMFRDGTWSGPIVIDSFGGTTGVACASTSLCIAPDGSGYVATFDGTNWSDPNNLVQVDTAPFAGLGGVTCTPTSFCAVFGFDNGAVYTFDGTQWSGPARVDAENSINGISCVSATFCVLVDSNDNAYVWNGTSWSQPTELDGGDFWGPSVSCVSESFCMVVNGSGRAFTFDGSSWSGPVVANPEGGLAGVSCTSETFCVALDGNGNAMRFDGSGWSTLTPVGESPQTSISCVSDTFCVAVTENGEAFTFDGSTWSGPDVIDDHPLTGVSCGTDSFCVAVDQVDQLDADGNVVSQTGRVLVFDGATWSSPVTLDTAAALTGVSCSGSSFCMAVGDDGKAFTYDGTSWSAGYPARGQLSGVSCSSPTFCVAINFDGAAMWF